jgi:beta-lactam-binding protein with PASTA domain
VRAGLKGRTQTIPGGPGIVIQTDPRHGTKVKRGSTITLYVF